MLQVTVPWTCQQYTTDMNRGKKRKTSQWVKVEHGVLAQLVSSTAGEMARECSTYYRRLAEMISIKQDKHSLVVSWLRTRLSYASLRAAVLCIHESRSSHATLFTNMTLPLPLLRVRYHPQSKNRSVTLLFCIVLYSMWIIVFGNPKNKKTLLHNWTNVQCTCKLQHLHVKIVQLYHRDVHRNVWVGTYF